MQNPPGDRRCVVECVPIRTIDTAAAVVMAGFSRLSLHSEQWIVLKTKVLHDAHWEPIL